MNSDSKKYMGMVLSVVIAICMTLPVSAALTSSEKVVSNYSGTYVLDLKGPMQDVWMKQMESRGIEIITKISDNSYEVQIDSQDNSLLAELPYVESITNYPIEMKISPDIKGNSVVISLLETGTLDGTVNEIQKYMGEIFVQDYTSTGYVIRGTVENPSMIETIAAFPDVHYIAPYIENELKDESGMQQVGGFLWVDDPDNDPDTPYRNTGTYGTYVNHLGWTGDGVLVGIADTGLGDGTTGDANHIDFENRVIGGTDYGAGDWADGHGHGTHCAGLIIANGYEGTGVTHPGFGDYYAGMGLAYDAEIYAQKIFTDAGGWAGPADSYTILEDAQRAGVMVHSNSWGSSSLGAYSDTDEAYDHAVRDADDNAGGNQQLIITVAASNDGPGTNTIGSPGNGKNVITVGATENYWPDMTSYGMIYDPNTDADNPDTIIDFSSRGWTDDNRIKPDVVAAGSGTLSTRSTDASIDCLYGTYDDNRYEWCSGTSQANPTVAGGVAVIYEWYLATYGTIITPSMAKALLINTAVDIGSSDIPNRNEGWGRMYLPTIMDPPAPFILSDEVGELTTGVTDTYEVSYSNPAEPLKITLAYTDRYALSGAAITLQNRVNLEVVSPLGTTYHGNAFVGGWSTTGNPSIDWDTNSDGYDDRNNVECVFIPPGILQTGQYTIRVIGSAISADCDFDGSNDQDYSLVIYNAVDVSSEGTIDLDSTAYSLEATVTVTVGDTDLNTNAFSAETVNINIDSDTEPAGESVTLTETGVDTSIFEGTIDISETNGAGILQVSHNDIITATYNDANDGTGPATVTDTAIVDGQVTAPSALTVEWWGQSLQVVYEEDFEGDGSPTFAELGWTTGGASNDWQIGTPSGLGGNYGSPDPVGAASGSFSIGNDLTGLGTYPGDYEASLVLDSNYIYSPAIDCSQASGTTLYFQRYLNVEQPTYDHAYVEVSNNGAIWNQVWTNGATIADSSWGEVNYDISTWADGQATVYIRFEVGASDGSWQYCGWNIDDLRLEATVSGGTNDNSLNWTLSGDDGAGSDDVVQYNIYRANNPSGPWDIGAYIDSVSAGIATYTDIGRGESDGIVWYYVVRAEDGAGNEDTNTVAIPEPGGSTLSAYDIPIPVGAGAGDWVFVSFPFVQSGNIVDLLDDTNGDAQTTWDIAKWYNSADGTWRTYSTLGAGMDTIPTFTEAMGIWLRLVTNGGDHMLTTGFTGDYSATPIDITLNPGWNLVGYPSASSQTAQAALSGTSATWVATYQAAAPYVTDTSALNTVTMSEGNAYWVYVTSASTWTLNP